MARLLAALLAFVAAQIGLAGAAHGSSRSWTAGAYSFSDELGGFRITGISGRGTRDDPVVISEELHSATPVTLVVRAVRPLRSFIWTGDFATGFIHLRIEARNGSGQAWVEFEFELQEHLGQASVFGDGLSFDQRREDGETVGSDRFGAWSRDFEPFDRLRFSNGHVDPRAAAGFRFFVTDFTPRLTFYILQDPRIPYS